LPRQRLGGRVGVSLHLWVPLDLAEAAKRLCVSRGTSLSAVVAEFLERWVSQAGEAVERVEDYELLKREYRRLSREFERLRALMRKVDPEGEMQEEALKLGLDFNTLNNMEEVIAKLLKIHNPPDQKLHHFINYLETAKHLLQKEQQLTNTRKQKYTPQETNSS